MLDACGVPVQSVQRAHRRLEIDKKLAWRLAKVLQGDDPYAAVRHVPGTAAMRRLFKRAEARHVSPAVLERARSAIDGFEAFSDTHAPSRRTLEHMLSAYTMADVEEADVGHRREAAISLGYLWGVLAAAQMRTYIVQRSNERGLLDVASIGGFVGLQWIRPNVGWVVHRTKCQDDDGQAWQCPPGEALDPGVNPGSAPILRDYCSTPLPPMRRVAIESGFVIDELIQSDVGRSTATTCLTGEIYRGLAPGQQDERNRQGNLVVSARTPCEHFLLDVLMHEDVARDQNPELLVYGDFELGSDSVPIAKRQRNRIMPWKRLEHLGRGIRGAYTPCFKRYIEMLDECLERLGWTPSEFRLLRASIPYPVNPSTVAVQCVLPERAP